MSIEVVSSAKVNSENLNKEIVVPQATGPIHIHIHLDHRNNQQMDLNQQSEPRKKPPSLAEKVGAVGSKAVVLAVVYQTFPYATSAGVVFGIFHGIRDNLFSVTKRQKRAVGQLESDTKKLKEGSSLDRVLAVAWPIIGIWIGKDPSLTLFRQECKQGNYGKSCEEVPDLQLVGELTALFSGYVTSKLFIKYIFESLRSEKLEKEGYDESS